MRSEACGIADDMAVDGDGNIRSMGSNNGYNNDMQGTKDISGYIEKLDADSWHQRRSKYQVGGNEFDEIYTSFHENA